MHHHIIIMWCLSFLLHITTENSLYLNVCFRRLL